jgi:hypothetical protein
MSHAIERMRQEYIKSLVGRHVVRRRRQIETADMTEKSPSPTCRCTNAASASWTRTGRETPPSRTPDRQGEALSRRRLIAMATAVALACLPTAARADITGNELWNVCQPNGDKEDKGFCYGYVIAIAEVARQQQQIGLYGWFGCLSENSTGQQLGDVVKRWLDQHPGVAIPPRLLPRRPGPGEGLPLQAVTPLPRLDAGL